MEGGNFWTPTPTSLSILCFWVLTGQAVSSSYVFAFMRKGSRRNNYLNPGHSIFWGGAGSEELPSRGEGRKESG